MVQNSIIVHNLNVLQFEELLKSTVKEQFDNFKSNITNTNDDELLTREETYKLLKIDSSTLWAWTKKGKIKAYGIANRRYYIKSEILKCLIPLNQ
jgi:hypothetical protein